MRWIIMFIAIVGTGIILFTIIFYLDQVTYNFNMNEGRMKMKASYYMKSRTNVVRYLMRREMGLLQINESSHLAQTVLCHRKLLKPEFSDVPIRTRMVFIMAVSPNRRRLAAAHGDHTIRIYDLATGKEVQTCVGHPRTPWCLQFHPVYDHILASGCLGGEVRVWDLHTKTSLPWPRARDSTAASLTFHPYEPVLAVACAHDVTFWNWTDMSRMMTWRFSTDHAKVRWIRFSPQGNALYTGTANRSSEDSMDQPTVSHIGEEGVHSELTPVYSYIREEWSRLQSSLAGWMSYGVGPAPTVSYVVRERQTNPYDGRERRVPPSEDHSMTPMERIAASRSAPQPASLATVVVDSRSRRTPRINIIAHQRDHLRFAGRMPTLRQPARREEPRRTFHMDTMLRNSVFQAAQARVAQVRQERQEQQERNVQTPQEPRGQDLYSNLVTRLVAQQSQSDPPVTAAGDTARPESGRREPRGRPKRSSHNPNFTYLMRRRRRARQRSQASSLRLSSNSNTTLRSLGKRPRTMETTEIQNKQARNDDEPQTSLMETSSATLRSRRPRAKVMKLVRVNLEDDGQNQTNSARSTRPQEFRSQDAIPVNLLRSRLMGTQANSSPVLLTGNNHQASETLLQHSNGPAIVSRDSTLNRPRPVQVLSQNVVRGVRSAGGGAAAGMDITHSADDISQLRSVIGSEVMQEPLMSISQNQGLDLPHGVREDPNPSHPSGDARWLNLETRQIAHRDYGVPILDQTVNMPRTLRRLINQTIAGLIFGRGDGAVASNILGVNYKIRRWDMRSTNDITVQIANNCVVKQCKIHNDSSVSLSPDGSLLAAFVPTTNMPEQNVLSIYSTLPATLGQCLFTKMFGPNAITVDFSPVGDMVLVGLASRRTMLSDGIFTIAQVYRLAHSYSGEKSMELIRNVVYSSEDNQSQSIQHARSHVSINAAVWLPHPCVGFAFGTTTSEVFTVQPGVDVTEDAALQLRSVGTQTAAAAALTSSEASRGVPTERRFS